MGWRLVGKPNTVRASRALATRFATMSTIPCDRPLSERRLVIYGRMFRAGMFRPVTWATCECLESGETYRVNGKHTSTMLSGLEEFPDDFFVVVEHYEADTIEDVAKLYATFDSRESVRTVRDINGSFASVVPDLAGIQAKLIDLVVSGISYARHQNEMFRIPPTERAEEILDHVDFARWVYDLLGARLKDNKFMVRSPVIAAMFLCHERSARDATRFWESVRDQTGTAPDLPDRELATWLMKHGVCNGSGTASATNASPHEFFVRCLHHWNAWRKAAKVKRYTPKAEIPLAI